MIQATCRCGQLLNADGVGAERVVCPRCKAKVRIRRPAEPAGDGYLRFDCPCGRRLKVRAENRPTHGRCPDCERVVPVPTGLGAVVRTGPEAPTEDLSAADAAVLADWSRRHVERRGGAPAPGHDPFSTVVPAVAATRIPPPGGPPARTEAGLRVCPGCKRPVHMGADRCQHCGAEVPRR